MQRPERIGGGGAAFSVLAAAGAALALYALTTPGSPRIPHRSGYADSAPGRAARGSRRFGRYAVVGRTVTVAKPRAELYAFWRELSNLPRFMENVAAVDTLPDGRARWTLQAPGDRAMTLVTEIVEEREGEHISWRSVEDSDIDMQGRVAFRDAPGGRGTRVEAIIAYEPPMGAVGRGLARMFGREPGVQARRELKRFKMLMETGEIASSELRPAHAHGDA